MHSGVFLQAAVMFFAVFHLNREVAVALDRFKKIPHLPAAAVNTRILSFAAAWTSSPNMKMLCGGQCTAMDSCKMFCYVGNECSGYNFFVASNVASHLPAASTQFDGCYLKEAEIFAVAGLDSQAELDKLFAGYITTPCFHSSSSMVWIQIEFPKPKLISKVYFIHDNDHNHVVAASDIMLQQVIQHPPPTGTSFTLQSGNQAPGSVSVYALYPPQYGRAVSFKSQDYISACRIWIE